jgi:hypothetical protein
MYMCGIIERTKDTTEVFLRPVVLARNLNVPLRKHVFDAMKYSHPRIETLGCEVRVKIQELSCILKVLGFLCQESVLIKVFRQEPAHRWFVSESRPLPGPGTQIVQLRIL